MGPSPNLSLFGMVHFETAPHGVAGHEFQPPVLDFEGQVPEYALELWLLALGQAYRHLASNLESPHLYRYL
jgi:hypothetical protein